MQSAVGVAESAGIELPPVNAPALLLRAVHDLDLPQVTRRYVLCKLHCAIFPTPTVVDCFTMVAVCIPGCQGDVDLFVRQRIRIIKIVSSSPNDK